MCQRVHIDGTVRHLDVGSTYPGAGENITSLLKRNLEVINKLKTVEAYHATCVVSQVPGTWYNVCMNASAVGKINVEVDRAYLAGLIDGDGCIMAHIEKHSEKKFGFRVRVSVKITQKESLLLNLLAKKYKVGKVRANRKGTVWQTHDWIVLNRTDVSTILETIFPYTNTKRKQIAIARQILNLSDATRQGLIKMARLADTLSKFNVRSKNRRKNFASMI